MPFHYPATAILFPHCPFVLSILFLLIRIQSISITIFSLLNCDSKVVTWMETVKCILIVDEFLVF